jgi:hypothetical protein
MPECPLPKSFDSLSNPELIRWIMEGFRRTVIHYGSWFRDVESQLGIQRASKIEAEAGNLSWEMIMNRLSSILGFEMEDGMPKALRQMSRVQLVQLLEAVTANWLTNDGVWFQTVEKHFGMDYARRCNDTCWSRFSPYEATRIKELLGLPEYPGIQGLKLSLGFRMYARLNRQTIEDVDDNAFVLKINECRVQAARKRKAMEDYPCKSSGMVEYPTFASAIDARIRTECLGCPPDKHPEAWYCAWKFILDRD